MFSVSADTLIGSPWLVTSAESARTGIRPARIFAACSIRSSSSLSRSFLVVWWISSGTTPRSSSGSPERPPTRLVRRRATRIRALFGSGRRGGLLSGEDSAELHVGPDVCAARPGVAIRSQDRTDLVVLPARGEDIRGAVAKTIDNEYYGSVVLLSEAVGVIPLIRKDGEDNREKR